MEPFFFTVVNPLTQEETRVNIKKHNHTTIVIGDQTILIEDQQLMELGALFISLAGNDLDFDSVNELLDGMDLPIEPIHELARAVIVP